jgi:iron(III) transport system permease protein
MTAGGAFRAFVLVVVVGFPAAALAVEAFRSGAFGLLVDPTTYDYLLNSLLLGAATAVLAILLAAPFALVSAFRRVPLAPLIEAAALAPLLVPLHVHTIGWMRIFGRQGLVTEALAEATGYVHDVRLPWCGIYLGPAWILATALFPLVALPALAGLRAIESDALDAARLLGRGRFAILRGVILPTIAPRVFAGAFFVFAIAAGSLPVTSLLDTPVLAQRVFFEFSRAENGVGAAAVQAAPLLLAALLLMAAAPRVASLGDERAVLRLRPSRGGVGWALLAAAPTALAAGPPVFGLVAKVREGALKNPDGPSVFQEVFARVREEFANSFLLSLTGAALLVVVGWAWARASSKARSFKDGAIAAATLAAPPVVLGVGVVVAWRFFDGTPVLGGVYASGIGLVLLAYAARFLPLVARALAPSFDGEVAAQEDAAKVAGLSAWFRARRVLWPLQRGAIAAAAALAYVLCFTELDATLMTYPADLRTVQVRIFNMVHYSRDEEVAALCLMAAVAALLPPAIVALLGRSSKRSAA